MNTQAAGIVVNRNKEGALALLSDLQKWFASRGIDCFDTLQAPLESFLSDIGLVVCLGGDGTLLAAAAKIRTRPIPIVGVNLGKLGFLTEVKQEEVYDELENFYAGRAAIEERLTLDCRALHTDPYKCRTFSALNDVVVSREGLTRMLHLSVRVGNEKLTRFSGDGVIVATPTGSTAYSLSAGGAIVHPALSAMVITPICPHASSLRPMVVSAEETISVLMEDGKPDARALLTLDGQGALEIDSGYTIQVTRSEVPVRLVTSSRRSYFANLRENFKFPG
ncbi:MAG: NAD(+)/NADH kinase [Candidatus Omnitrophica bacterium]|nr:NAD(+)/NADH kinase [Candidatus Omnitrophota bacterium]